MLLVIICTRLTWYFKTVDDIEGVSKNTCKSVGDNIKISARDHLSQLLWLMADWISLEDVCQAEGNLLQEKNVRF